MLAKHMKRFFWTGPKKLSGPKKLAVQKTTEAVFEAGERAVRDGIFGARGAESILQVVVVPRVGSWPLKSLHSRQVL